MSFIDTTKYADDDTLVALHSNVRRVIHTTTSSPTKTTTDGSFSFERIQPRSKNFGMKNVYIVSDMTLTITLTTGTKFKLENINAALYDTTLSINGSIQFTQQPYINYLIKNNYDKGEFIEYQNLHHDKYVYYTITAGAAEDGKTPYTVKYHCTSPIYHSFFDNDLVGIDNMNLMSQFNLRNLIKIQQSTNYDTISAFSVSDLKFDLRYDEVQYTVPLENYNIQVPHYVYYSATNKFTSSFSVNDTLTEKDDSFEVNVRDVKSQPLRVFLAAVQDIRNTGNNNIMYTPEMRFKNISWDVNNQTNVMNTGTVSDIYLTSKNAGLLTEFNVYAGMKAGTITDDGISIDPICAINMLDTFDSKISTADLFRLSVSGNININRPVDAAAGTIINRYVYAVYEYPAILSISPMSSGLIYSLNGTFNELIELEDDESYLKQLEESGMYGGSKFGDWIKRTWQKIKSGKFVSKALNFLGNTKKYNNLLSMIPGVGTVMPIIGKIQDVAGDIGKKAEDAGYGVNMF